MSAVNEAAATLPGIPPERVTADPLERLLYARDLAVVPPILVRPFFRTLPDVVVRPADVDQVAAVVGYAARQRLPVTPRAAATTSYFDAVPVRGGLVLDLNGLRGLVELDADRRTVRVLPGTTWFELDEELRRQGFAVKSYPSSAVAATVGGWLSTQGHGIGSLKYGSLGGQVVGLQVVLPRSEVRALSRESDPPSAWFIGAEGTLGAVTEVTITVREVPAAESHHLLAFEDYGSLGDSVKSLCRSDNRPFTVFFADGGYLDLLARAGFGSPLGANAPASGVAGADPAAWDQDLARGRPASRRHERGILLACFQGSREEVSRGKDLLRGLPGRELPSEEALAEWNERLFHLRCKRAGPSLLAAEQWLPLNGLSGYLRAVQRLAWRFRQVVGTYGFAVTPDRALVMSVYPADERRPLAYLAAIGLTKALHDLGARYGGRPYGVGLWNTAYLSRLFGRAEMAELRRRKALLDPTGIMNPGKLYQAPLPLRSLVFGPGARALSVLHLALQWGR